MKQDKRGGDIAFNEITKGLSLSYPSDVILKSYASLTMREEVLLNEAVKEFGDAPAWLLRFFLEELPIDKKNRKKIKKLNRHDFKLLARSWFAENDCFTDEIFFG
jgi:hypothetical protein